MQTIKPQVLNARFNKMDKNHAKVLEIVTKMEGEQEKLKENQRLLFSNDLRMKEEIQEIRRFLGEKFGGN